MSKLTKPKAGVFIVATLLLLVLVSLSLFRTAAVSSKRQLGQVRDLDADTILSLMDIKAAKFSIPYSENIKLYGQLYEGETISKDNLLIDIGYPRANYHEKTYEHSVAIIPTTKKGCFNIFWNDIGKDSNYRYKTQLDLADQFSPDDDFTISLLRTDKLEFNLEGEAILFIMILNKNSDVPKPFLGGPLNSTLVQELIKNKHDMVVVFKLKTEI